MILTMLQMIQIDEKKVLKKKYKLRRTGSNESTIEITIPKEVVERAARKYGISRAEATQKLLGVWAYNSFEGLLLTFEQKEAAETP